MKQSFAILISILLATILFFPSSMLARQLSGETSPFVNANKYVTECAKNPYKPCPYPQHPPYERPHPPQGHP